MVFVELHDNLGEVVVLNPQVFEQQIIVVVTNPALDIGHLLCY